MSWFLEHVSSSKVQEGENTLIWKHEGKGKYSVKSYYISLRAKNNLLFLAKEVWRSGAPLKTRFFFFWESSVGEDINCRYVDKEGMVLG